MRNFFYERIFPILTPLSVDPSHPFPYISNISMNLGILVVPEKPEEGEQEPRFARVKLPLAERAATDSGQGRGVLLRDARRGDRRRTSKSLFPGMRMLECQPFRITRDADIEIEEDEAGDLLKTVEQQVRHRRFGFGVRLEVASGMSPHMVKLLRSSLEMDRAGRLHD